MMNLSMGDRYNLFTDASSMEGHGKKGCCMEYILLDGMKIVGCGHRICRDCGNTLAEAGAVWLGLQSRLRRGNPGKALNIFTDALSIVKAVKREDSAWEWVGETSILCAVIKRTLTEYGNGYMYFAAGHCSPNVFTGVHRCMEQFREHNGMGIPYTEAEVICSYNTMADKLAGEHLRRALDRQDGRLSLAFGDVISRGERCIA